ncbi:transposase [Streptomyces roseoverticillatus]|uniref:Transposase n=1 Tax=Streptomyces roseoverticillatus TaxID=66429 RepID=A0ABV3IXM6_9ACTN
MQLADAERESTGPYLSVGEYGPYPEWLRQHFEGVIRRFRTGGQWWEMPQDSDAWATVHDRFRQWRDAGVFEALLESLIAEAAKRGEVDLSLTGVDSTTVRAGHDAGLCKERNTVERLIDKLKAWRAIATRYGKTSDSYLAGLGLHLRALMIWIKEAAPS